MTRLNAVARTRSDKGTRSHLAGGCAEEIVERHYASLGRPVEHRRWRGTCGEIDLVVRDGDAFVFIEVKSARDFTRAAERVTRRQISRICAAASEFLGSTPLGQLSDVRFDVALVDRTGRVDIRENAFGV